MSSPTLWSRTAGGRAPDSLERYFIFQTLVGVWPITPERLEGYVEKALREAKRHTNWVDQNHDWEQRAKRFAVALLTHEPFIEAFEPFVAEVAAAGERSALGQLLLKLTVPGVPDVYQGDELIDLSLVDPDNRRPVDWDARRTALDALHDGAQPSRETMKLHLISRALELRARRPAAFAPGGAYAPVEAGPDVVAFSRGEGADIVVVVPLRRVAGEVTLMLPAGEFVDVLSGRRHSLDGSAVLTSVVEPHAMALLERA